MPDPQIPPDGEVSDSSSSLSCDEYDKLEALLVSHARPGACPPPDLLFAAEQDVLPAAAGASIRKHAAHCALCQTLLSELPADDSAFAPPVNARIQSEIQTRIGQHSPVSARSTRKPTFWLAVAALAAVAIVAIGLGSLLTYRQSHLANPTVALNHLPASTPADLPELHQIAPLAPPDDVPALVMRGVSAAHGPSVQDLMPAFRAYNRGDFAQAATAFAPLAARFPQSDIPPLYLGISQLQLGQNADAQHSLAQAYALAGSARHEAAAWYLAIADLRLNQSLAAAPLLSQLCTQTASPYASRACTLAPASASQKAR